MAYTIIDLLNKLVMIEKDAVLIYKQISTEASGNDIKLSTVAKVLTAEEKRHIHYLKAIRDEVEQLEDIEIDFDVYDKAFAVLHDYQTKLVKPRVQNVKELLLFASGMEEENLALLLYIQGRLVRTEDDTQKQSYRVLTQLIDEEKKHAVNLKLFI